MAIELSRAGRRESLPALGSTPTVGDVATAETDGRLARTRRTRTAIVDALIDLLRAGETNPSAAQIAERAGVSKRSVFVHYDTLEDLYRDVADRSTQLVIGLLWVIDPELPLDARIDAICDQRAKVHETIGPLRRAAALRASTSPAAAESQRFARQSSRDQVNRVFARELAPLDEATRARRAAAITALLSGEVWDLWRSADQLGVDESRATMHDALGALLAIRRRR
jgi:TetR/AcrR family transcriptional regulator of autoinduction and epiphytic fitness